jgi:hypothetical protein
MEDDMDSFNPRDFPRLFVSTGSITSRMFFLGTFATIIPPSYKTSIFINQDVKRKLKSFNAWIVEHSCYTFIK